MRCDFGRRGDLTGVGPGRVLIRRLVPRLVFAAGGRSGVGTSSDGRWHRQRREQQQWEQFHHGTSAKTERVQPLTGLDPEIR